MAIYKNILFLACAVALLATVSYNSGCVSYRFKDVSIDPNAKTVKVNFFENTASYVNPQLSQKLTEKLRQKIVNQTRLSQTNSDSVHYEISGRVTDYSVSTSGISNQKEASNRLTVGVHVIFNNHLKNEVQEFDVSRSFDFSATLSLQQAETRLSEDILRDIPDEIFNHIFSQW